MLLPCIRFPCTCHGDECQCKRSNPPPLHIHLLVQLIAPRSHSTILPLLLPLIIPTRTLLSFLLGSLLQLLQHLRRLPRIPTLHPDPFSIPEEQEWERHADQRQESRDAARPMDAQPIIHVGREEREHGTEDASEKGVGSEDAGGVDGVGVDEVVHDGEEKKDHAEAEGGGEHDADDPVDARIVRPSEDEEADGEADAADHAGREAGLWRRAVSTFAYSDRFGASVAVVVGDGIDDGSEHADEDAQEGQRADALGPVAVFLVDLVVIRFCQIYNGGGEVYNWKSAEQHVQCPVDDGLR